MGEFLSLAVPGDKSITHRLLILGALTRGESRIAGALTSLDIKSTARVLRALGARITPVAPGAVVRVTGRGSFRRPGRPLDCGNSGTTARLSLGALAAHSFRATLTGDASLRRRPMRRVTEPLERMGARFSGSNLDRLPLSVRGGGLAPIEWEMPVSSAQIKGAILFAGVAARCPVAVREPTGRSRDHTERLLRSFGFTVTENEAGWVHFLPDGRLEPFSLEVPGDASSGAFLVGAGLVRSGGAVRVTGVGVNPTRTGFLRVLERMGARVILDNARHAGGEPVADLLVEPAELRATTVTAGEIPSLIDEIPLLAVVASRARGVSRFLEVGELRVKESNRLALLAENLRAVGVEATASEDTLEVEGTDRAPRGRIRTDGDHRIAMAFAVLGLADGAAVKVDDLQCAAISFPGFDRTLRSLKQGRPRSAVPQ
jgi:3-phosphoshikimate 1-carboxyvinyltransferase